MSFCECNTSWNEELSPEHFIYIFYEWEIVPSNNNKSDSLYKRKYGSYTEVHVRLSDEKNTSIHSTKLYNFRAHFKFNIKYCKTNETEINDVKSF